MNKREASNADKSKSGRNTKDALTKLLQRTVLQFPTIKLEENVKYGEKGKDQTQFKIKHQLNFTDSKLYWLIDETSSFKNDRVKGKQFVMEHTKKILHERGIDNEAYFVVPDNCNNDTLRNLQNFKKHIQANDQVNFFDGAMQMSEFSHLLEQKATESMKQGQKSNILGDYGEKILVQAFNNQKNIKLWNNPADYITKSTNYSLFKSVLNKLDPNIKEIQYSRAFRGIKNDNPDSVSSQLLTVRDGNGKSYGKPKTDVLIQILDKDNQTSQFSVSVKKPASVKGRVTIHEGSVERLLNDLRNSIPSNSIFNDEEYFNRLEHGLKNFQEVGSQKKMTIEDKEFLNNHLSDLNKWLIDYFVFGINNKMLNNIQIAQALLVFNPLTGQCQIKSIKETEEEMLHGKMATFGTPFSWTYPSNKRGKKIQIKGPFNISL